jgi:hypothetical protein
VFGKIDNYIYNPLEPQQPLKKSTAPAIQTHIFFSGHTSCKAHQAHGTSPGAQQGTAHISSIALGKIDNYIYNSLEPQQPVKKPTAPQVVFRIFYFLIYFFILEKYTIISKFSKTNLLLT